MTRALRRVSALLALAALATGCDGVDPDATPTQRTAHALPDVPELSAPPATPEPVSTIPVGVTLQHEADWQPLGWPGRTPLHDVCLDPGTGGLYLPDTTDYRAVGSGARFEALGVYRGPGRAGMAVDAWREQARTCGGPGSVDHTGMPMEWVVREVRVTGADEAWQAHLLMTVEGPDLGEVTSFLTIVRVGTAVHVQGDRAHSAPSRVPGKSAAGLASVAAYVPTLAVFRSR